MLRWNLNFLISYNCQMAALWNAQLPAKRKFPLKILSRIGPGLSFFLNTVSPIDWKKGFRRKSLRTVFFLLFIRTQKKLIRLKTLKTVLFSIGSSQKPENVVFGFGPVRLQRQARAPGSSFFRLKAPSALPFDGALPLLAPLVVRCSSVLALVSSAASYANLKA